MGRVGWLGGRHRPPPRLRGGPPISQATAAGAGFLPIVVPAQPKGVGEKP